MNNHIIELKQKSERYFANKKVSVVKIYTSVNLVKIKFEDTDICTVVDINALSEEADLTQTISFKVLGG